MKSNRILKSIARAIALGAGLTALVGCQTTDYHNGHHGDHYRSGYYYGGDSYRPVASYRQYNAYPVVGYSPYSPYSRHASSWRY